MRFVVIIVAALMIFGLAAFGLVSAQKGATPTGTVASTVRLASAAQNVPALPARAPLSQIAQATGSEGGCRRAGPAALPACRPASPRRRLLRPLALLRRQASQNNIPACDNSGGMGLSRIVEIDTTGGPGFGFEHFKQYDFLRDKEVVLTFDDGPWPKNTPAVLKALTEECLKATFFEIGEHAVWHPEITKQVIEAGMTVGTHTWSHKDLARNPYAKDLEQAEAGNRDGQQRRAYGRCRRTGRAVLPLPRPATYAAASRPISASATWRFSRPTSTSFDFKMRKPDQVVKSVMISWRSAAKASS